MRLRKEGLSVFSSALPLLCLALVKARQSTKSGKAEEGRPLNFTDKARQGKAYR
jgi:hypothetical protein